jgi:hypothetical protein
MEGIKDRVKDKKAFRKVKVAVLKWLCEREVALEAAEADADAARASKAARHE